MAGPRIAARTVETDADLIFRQPPTFKRSIYEFKVVRDKKWFEEEDFSPGLWGTEAMQEVHERVQKVSADMEEVAKYEDPFLDQFEEKVYPELLPNPIGEEALRRHEERVLHATEVERFAGYFTTKSILLPGTSSKVKKISKIGTDKLRNLAPPDYEDKVKFVGVFHYQGFSDKGPNPLPHHVDTRFIFNKVTDAQDKMELKMQRYKPEFEKMLYSKQSRDILQDVFFWIFIEIFEKYDLPKSKCHIFDRISQNYVSLLLSLKHPFYREVFLKTYPDLLCQAVYSAYCNCFIPSHRTFDDNFKENICEIIHGWISGLKPTPRSWLKWNLEVLEPRSLHKKKRDGSIKFSIERNKKASSLRGSDLVQKRRETIIRNAVLRRAHETYEKDNSKESFFFSESEAEEESSVEELSISKPQKKSVNKKKKSENAKHSNLKKQKQAGVLPSFSFQSSTITESSGGDGQRNKVLERSPGKDGLKLDKSSDAEKSKRYKLPSEKRAMEVKTQFEEVREAYLMKPEHSNIAVSGSSESMQESRSAEEEKKSEKKTVRKKIPNSGKDKQPKQRHEERYDSIDIPNSPSVEKGRMIVKDGGPETTARKSEKHQHTSEGDQEGVINSQSQKQNKLGNSETKSGASFPKGAVTKESLDEKNRSTSPTTTSTSGRVKKKVSNEGVQLSEEDKKRIAREEFMKKVFAVGLEGEPPPRVKSSHRSIYKSKSAIKTKSILSHKPATDSVKSVKVKESNVQFVKKILSRELEKMKAEKTLTKDSSLPKMTSSEMKVIFSSQSNSLKKNDSSMDFPGTKSSDSTVKKKKVAISGSADKVMVEVDEKQEDATAEKKKKRRPYKDILAAARKELMTRESHPTCKGPEMNRCLFNLKGHSPLVANILRKHNLVKNAGTHYYATRSEMENLPALDAPTYKDLIADSFKTCQKIKHGYDKHVIQCDEALKRHVLFHEASLKEHRKKVEALFEHPREVTKLCELLILGQQNENTGTKYEIRKAVQNILDEQLPTKKAETHRKA